MPPDVKRIILSNMNVKLYGCTLTFRKRVKRRQISAEVVMLISKLPMQFISEFNSERDTKSGLYSDVVVKLARFLSLRHGIVRIK